MYFCNECNYSYDIGKSTNLESDNKTIIKKIPDIYKKLENKEDLKNFKTDIKIDDIKKNSKYKDLDETQKKNINKLYEESYNIGINFKCTNCGHSKEIKESILLYNLDLNNKIGGKLHNKDIIKMNLVSANLFTISIMYFIQKTFLKIKQI